MYPKTIMCIKWGTLFSAAEVNVLFRSCVLFGGADIRFICATDDAEGLDPGIDVREIPDLGLPDSYWKKPGVWRKTCLYHSDFHDLDHVLFIDLDMVVCGSLDVFFTSTEGITFLNVGSSWRPNTSSTHIEHGTGIFSYSPKGEVKILDAFLADPDAAIRDFRNEQDFASFHATASNVWQEGLVVSFKRHLCHRHGTGLFKSPKSPDADTSVVAFHGNPRPSDTRTGGVWGAFPHLHFGRVGWLEHHYARFSKTT